MADAKKAEKKYHWYLLSFAVPTPGLITYVSVFTNTDTQQITMPVLRAARNAQQIPPQSCLISVSYIGRMTRSEMNPPVEEPKPVMEATEAFKRGVADGIQYTMGSEPVTNPYVPDPKATTISQEATEWFSGFSIGQRYRRETDMANDKVIMSEAVEG